MEGGKESLSSGSGQWSEDAVRLLIESYTSKFMELQRSNLRQKDWQDVLAKISSACGEGYSYSRCRNKLDSLKKKFKNVKNRRSSSGSKAGVKWKWYDQMEKLMDRSSSSSSSSRQGIPGGITSGEKPGPSAVEDDGEASESSAEGEDEDNGNENIPNYLFPGGFLESGLNLALSGLYQGGGGLHGLRPSSDRGIGKKRVKPSSNRGVKEVMATVIEALERVEKNRLEFEERRLESIKQLELKRNETNLEIARYIVESCRSLSFQQTGSQFGGMK